MILKEQPLVLENEVFIYYEKQNWLAKYLEEILTYKLQSIVQLLLAYFSLRQAFR